MTDDRQLFVNTDEVDRPSTHLTYLFHSLEFNNNCDTKVPLIFTHNRVKYILTRHL